MLLVQIVDLKQQRNELEFRLEQMEQAANERILVLKSDVKLQAGQVEQRMYMNERLALRACFQCLILAVKRQLVILIYTPRFPEQGCLHRLEERITGLNAKLQQTVPKQHYEARHVVMYSQTLVKALSMLSC